MLDQLDSKQLKMFMNILNQNENKAHIVDYGVCFMFANCVLHAYSLGKKMIFIMIKFN